MGFSSISFKYLLLGNLCKKNVIDKFFRVVFNVIIVSLNKDMKLNEEYNKQIGENIFYYFLVCILFKYNNIKIFFLKAKKLI
jgi:hypothetical protein